MSKSYICKKKCTSSDSKNMSSEFWRSEEICGYWLIETAVFMILMSLISHNISTYIKHILSQTYIMLSCGCCECIILSCECIIFSCEQWMHNIEPWIPQPSFLSSNFCLHRGRLSKVLFWVRPWVNILNVSLVSEH